MELYCLKKPALQLCCVWRKINRKLKLFKLLCLPLNLPRPGNDRGNLTLLASPYKSSYALHNATKIMSCQCDLPVVQLRKFGDLFSSNGHSSGIQLLLSHDRARSDRTQPPAAAKLPLIAPCVLMSWLSASHPSVHHTFRCVEIAVTALWSCYLNQSVPAVNSAGAP